MEVFGQEGCPEFKDQIVIKYSEAEMAGGGRGGGATQVQGGAKQV